MVQWPEGTGTLLDPACGDGVFLEAAVRKVLAAGRSREQVVSILEQRLVGWDVDATHVLACQERLRGVLEGVGLPEVRLRVECRDALVATADIPVACVVGNPPYLEAKRMPDSMKRAIRAAFLEAAEGGFDLFCAFVALALRLTRDGGEICLVLPNRFLTSTYAARLRRTLALETLAEVYDLSTERIFPDAAVYPIIVHSRRGASGNAAGVMGPHPGARWFCATPEMPRGSTDIWSVTPADPRGLQLIRRLMTDESFERLDRVADVRWTVSFHRAGLRDLFVTPERPRWAFRPRRFLGGGRFHGNREVLPFRIRWHGWWIDYDEERAGREGNPLPPLAMFESPKVVVCQNARRLRAAVDREGFVLKDTFLAVIPHRPFESAEAHGEQNHGLFGPSPVTDRGPPAPSPEWLCMLLQSNLMHYLYEHLFAGTRKRGGYLQYLPRFLSILPVARCPDEEVAGHLAARLSQGEPVWKEVEALVLDAFEVSHLQRKALQEFPFPSHAEE